MSKRLLLRMGVLAAATVFALSGCFFFGGFDMPDDWDEDLTIVAEWDEDYGDVDLHVSYPYSSDDTDGYPNTTRISGDPSFTELYFDNVDDFEARGDEGFFLSDSPTFREIVSPGNLKSTVTYTQAHAVEMTQEANDGGPEIVMIRRPPFNSTNLAYRTRPNNSLGLSTSYQDFAWIGVGEVYVHGDSGNLVSSGGYSANVSVTIYNDSGNELARLTLPEDMDLTSMSVARIHYFVARTSSLETFYYYVIVPDVRTMPNGTSDFRGLSGSIAVYGDGAVGIVGSARE